MRQLHGKLSHSRFIISDTLLQQTISLAAFPWSFHFPGSSPIFAGSSQTDSTCWITHMVGRESPCPVDIFPCIYPLSPPCPLPSTPSVSDSEFFFFLTSERPEGNKFQQDIHAVKLLRTFIYHSFEAKTSVPFLWWKEFVRGNISHSYGGPLPLGRDWAKCP